MGADSTIPQSEMAMLRAVPAGALWRASLVRSASAPPWARSREYTPPAQPPPAQPPAQPQTHLILVPAFEDPAAAAPPPADEEPPAMPQPLFRRDALPQCQ